MSRPSERGLGRGLGALLPTAATPSTAGLQEIPLERIQANPDQPRTRFDADALQDLASSIAAHGVLQPVLVSRQPDGAYQLIAGERRWRAAQLAGLATITALVKEAAPQSRLEMALVENIQRRDLNALEEAHAYRQLLEEHGLTQEQLAQRIGRSRVTIANTLRLLNLPEPVQRALIDGEITEGHARAILSAPAEAAQFALLERVVRDGLNVRQTEALARTPEALLPLATAPETPPAAEAEAISPQADPDLARLEEAFRHALGTRVQISRGRAGGKLVIHFYSDDQLLGLYEAITGAQP